MSLSPSAPDSFPFRMLPSGRRTVNAIGPRPENALIGRRGDERKEKPGEDPALPPARPGLLNTKT